jgi:hypothetical protein
MDKNADARYIIEFTLKSGVRKAEHEACGWHEAFALTEAPSMNTCLD